MEKDAICLCKNKGRVNRDSLTVLSAEGNMIDPYVLYSLWKRHKTCLYHK